MMMHCQVYQFFVPPSILLIAAEMIHSRKKCIIIISRVVVLVDSVFVVSVSGG